MVLNYNTLSYVNFISSFIWGSIEEKLGPNDLKSNFKKLKLNNLTYFIINFFIKEQTLLELQEVVQQLLDQQIQLQLQLYQQLDLITSSA